MQSKHRSVYTRIALAALICVAVPAFADQSKVVTKGPIVIHAIKHDTGPLLREIEPLLPEFSTPSEHEIQNNANPNQHWRNLKGPDAVLQRPGSGPTTQTPNFNVEFDGLGFGEAFFCNCMPPDNDGAPGTTQYVQYINLTYGVYSKTGTLVLGPLSGNSFWTGFGGSCQADNSGDPIIRFDAAAQRWVVSQFAINSSAPDYECVAVSQTADATGAYNRYAFAINEFPDYPKMGVWPDAYYFTFNNFNIAGTAFVGANACAVDRTAMLAGNAASMICFQQNSSQFGQLPSDLDGATPPAAGTPNFVMQLDPSGSANLDLFKFHVDFTTPANSTFTGPTQIPVAAFTPLCNGIVRGRCVPQPTSGSDLLESLGDRLMYRLVYRNFGDHTTLLTTHSIVAGTSGGVRWYEIRNPETAPTVFQSGTFAPDAQYRFMPAIAMDKNQDLAVGYTVSGTAAGQYPSLVYAGRIPSDPAGTLESEVVMKTGAGSQSSGIDRWGDYSSLTVDPTDDCTFWFSEEYEKTTGGFNWSTAIGSFTFPNCGVVTPDFSLSANPATVSVVQGISGTSTITVTPLGNFTGSVALSVSGLPASTSATISTDPVILNGGGPVAVTATFLATNTAPPGTYSLTVTGVSGGLTHTIPLTLIINQATAPTVTLSPTTLTWGNINVGQTSGVKTVTMTNSGTATLNIASIAASGDFSLQAGANPCGATLAVGKNCVIRVVFSPIQIGARTGTVTITDNAGNSPQSVPLSGTGAAPVSLTPAKQGFPNEKVGVTSPAKTLTLFNHLPTTLNSIVINPSGDFAVSSTTCGASLAARTSCQIMVTFTPTATGLRTGTLSVSDSALTSPQSSNLSGAGK